MLDSGGVGGMLVKSPVVVGESTRSYRYIFFSTCEMISRDKIGCIRQLTEIICLPPETSFLHFSSSGLSAATKRSYSSRERVSRSFWIT